MPENSKRTVSHLFPSGNKPAFSLRKRQKIKPRHNSRLDFFVFRLYRYTKNYKYCLIPIERSSSNLIKRFAMPFESLSAAEY